MTKLTCKKTQKMTIKKLLSTSVNYDKDNDEARMQEDAENDNQEAFEFVKQHLKQLHLF